MNYCAVILARGGSKGIPGKNLIDLSGKPLIFWTIRFAQMQRDISDIIVSSDSDEILNYCQSLGVSEALLRPSNLAQDLSTDLDTFNHVLMNSEIVKSYDLLAHLRPTNPFRRFSWFKNIRQLIEANPTFSSIRSLEPANENPYKMWHLSDDKKIKNVISDSIIPEHHSAPRQILPTAFKQNAHLDIIRKSSVLNGSMVGDNALGVVVEQGLPDIDTMLDLDFARINFTKFIDPNLVF
ncbi:acylneuraminate cytidylyltransferase family protein [Amylibacter sp.]|nr:acylneuraminate cytidylyltransferase family protein [Amylibacter sp.]